MSIPVLAGKGKSKSASGPQTLASVTVPAGGLLVVTLSYNPITFIDGSLSWSGDGGLTLTAGRSAPGVGITTETHWCYSAGGGTGTVQWSFDDFTFYEIKAITLSDPSSSTPYDKDAGATATSTSPSSGATAATTQADEVALCYIATNGPVEDGAGTISNGFTSLDRDGTTGGTATSNVTGDLLYKVLTSTGAQTGAKTGITSREWADVIATFKITPVAPQSSTPSSTGLAAAVGSALAVAGAVAVVAASVALAAVVGGCTSVLGPVSSTPDSVEVASGIGSSTGVAGLRVVAAESVAVMAEMHLDPADVTLTLSADRDPTAVTSLGFVPVRPASGNLGDSDELTWDEDVHSGPGLGTATVVATGAVTPAPRVLDGIDYIVFVARGFWLYPGAGVVDVSSHRFTVTVGGSTAGASSPDNLPVLAAPDDPTARMAEIRSNPMGTKPGGGAWTWADVDSMANLSVLGDYEASAGASATLRVGEVWVEVYGPAGSAPSVIGIRQRIGDLRRPQRFIQQVEGSE